MRGRECEGERVWGERVWERGCEGMTMREEKDMLGRRKDNNCKRQLKMFFAYFLVPTQISDYLLDY